MSLITILTAGPLTTVQDAGRQDCLGLGLAASGPMDRGSFDRAGAMLESASAAGIEFATGGLALIHRGETIQAGGAGGEFRASINGTRAYWPLATSLNDGDTLTIRPGPSGNFGYLRLSHEFDLPSVLGSLSTNLRAGLGGFAGRALRPGDEIGFADASTLRVLQPTLTAPAPTIRFTWGLHADLFDTATRAAILASSFRVTSAMDRMGLRLGDPDGVFAGVRSVSLVSDVVVCGDVQILGDGTPIVLLRDHQPTGGYPRIGTVLPDDLDRLVQMRPGAIIGLESVSIAHAQRLAQGQMA